MEVSIWWTIFAAFVGPVIGVVLVPVLVRFCPCKACREARRWDDGK
jgi:hypothetical protein